MGSYMQLPQDAARVWGDPSTREHILRMHADNVPLVDMVEAVGLTGALEADWLRAAIENLTPADVAQIRAVFVAEAEQAGPRGGANFPVDCRVDTPTDTVQVTTIPAATDAVTPVVRVQGT
ncbi:MAG: hypothetical protein ABJC79_11370 [Acidimicrobiia bacterium]